MVEDHDETIIHAATMVIVENRGSWLKLVLNRPDKLNAFNEAMHAELVAALDQAAENDDCRALLLTGAGRGFCAGQDLGDRVTDAGVEPVDLGKTIDSLWNPLVRRIRTLPKPVVCAVNGVAAGAGANLAFACDIVLAAQSAKFIQSFAGLGLVPDTGGTFFLPRLVGDARAKALAMLGVPLNALKAEEWGLIWKTVSDEALEFESESIANMLAALPRSGLAAIKVAFSASADNDLDRQLDLERDLQREAGHSPDYAEAVRAFMESRRSGASR